MYRFDLEKAATKVNKHAGFSLIELLVVVGIIAVLSVVATVAFKGYANKGKLAHGLSWRDSVFKQLKLAYESSNPNPTITIGNGDLLVAANGASSSNIGNIFPLLNSAPFPTTSTSTVTHRGWVRVNNAPPIHSFVIQSRTQPNFNGTGTPATLIGVDFCIDDMEGATGFVQADETAAYATPIGSSRSYLRNLLVLQDGVWQLFCGGANMGPANNQKGDGVEYLESMGCTCKTVSTGVTNIAGLNCN